MLGTLAVPFSLPRSSTAVMIALLDLRSDSGAWLCLLYMHRGERERKKNLSEPGVSDLPDLSCLEDHISVTLFILLSTLWRVATFAPHV